MSKNIYDSIIEGKITKAIGDTYYKAGAVIAAPFISDELNPHGINSKKYAKYLVRKKMESKQSSNNTKQNTNKKSNKSSNRITNNINMKNSLLNDIDK